MEFTYFIKFTKPSLSSGIPSWISLYTGALTFLKYLMENRNSVCTQAMFSQITDPTPVGGWSDWGWGRWREIWSSCHRNALLYSIQQNWNPFLLSQVSLLFFQTLLFSLFFTSLSFLFPLSQTALMESSHSKASYYPWRPPWRVC